MTDNNGDVVARVFRDYLEQRCWVEWRLEHDERGRPVKVPYVPGTNRKARTNDPSTFGTFHQCRGDQRGLVLSDDDLGGVDLDGCRDPDSGRLSAWAQEVVTEFGSYAEVSPSGTGVHVFALGKPATTRYKKVALPDEPPTSNKQPGFEIFSGLGHFITVTGELLPDALDELRSAPSAWAQLIRRQAVPQPASASVRPRPTTTATTPCLTWHGGCGWTAAATTTLRRRSSRQQRAAPGLRHQGHSGRQGGRQNIEVGAAQG